jgi:hypothetical protein
MKIVHVAQREAHHCGIACLTMITGTPYEIVLESVQESLDDFESYGVRNADLAIWLTSWHHEADPSNPPWKYKRFAPYRVWSEYDLATWPRAPHIVSIREHTKGPCHVVVVQKGRVYDPETKHPHGLPSYDRINFRLIGVVGTPDVLEAARASA